MPQISKTGVVITTDNDVVENANAQQLTGVDNLGNTVDLATTTDSDGEFAFTELIPSVLGTGPATGYTVTETLPGGHSANPLGKVAATGTQGMRDTAAKLVVVAVAMNLLYRRF